MGKINWIPPPALQFSSNTHLQNILTALIMTYNQIFREKFLELCMGESWRQKSEFHTLIFDFG